MGSAPRPEGQLRVDSNHAAGNLRAVLRRAVAPSRVVPLLGGLAAFVLGACREASPGYAEPGPEDTEQPLMCEGVQPGTATLRLLTLSRLIWSSGLYPHPL